MAIYVMSDIHGRDEALLSLAAVPRLLDGEDELYIIGDLFDRGDGNADVARWFASAPDSVRLLRGNHDEMMVSDTAGDYAMMSIADPARSMWANNGFSFKTTDDLLNGTTVEERERVYRRISEAPLMASVSAGGVEYVLVHAGLRPPSSLFKRNDRSAWLQQDARDCLWIRDDWLRTKASPPFRTVFGHTTVRHIQQRQIPELGAIRDANGMRLDMDDDARVLFWNNRLAIDCGCAHSIGGRLALVRLDDLHVWYADARLGGIVLEEDLCDRYPELAG